MLPHCFSHQVFKWCDFLKWSFENPLALLMLLVSEWKFIFNSIATLLFLLQYRTRCLLKRLYILGNISRLWIIWYHFGQKLYTVTSLPLQTRLFHRILKIIYIGFSRLYVCLYNVWTPLYLYVLIFHFITRSLYLWVNEGQ